MIVSGKDCICDGCSSPFKRHLTNKGRYCSLDCYWSARRASAGQRFDESYIPEPNSGCWLWTGYLYGNGYPAIYVSGRRQLAHRFSYSRFVGDIGRGKYVLHQCDTPSCVNPQHLSVGTQLDNMREAVSRGRTARGERLSLAQRRAA